MKVKDLVKIIGWDIINPFSLRLKRNKKYKFSNADFNGINIGCGINNPSNWLGIDGGFTHYLIHKVPKPIYRRLFKTQKMASNYTFDDYYKLSKGVKLIHHELMFGLPFENNSVPNIFTSHFLEHITYEVCENLLKECYRVMQQEGIIRICVPSLKEAVAEMQQAIDDYKSYNKDVIQNYVTFNMSGYNSPYSNHRYMYDYSRMQNLLEKVGFRDIEERKFKEGKIPDVEVLDTRGGLIIEAVK